MHQALYRKWRPKNFDDVFGQEHITSVLRYQAEQDLCSHAYLFCGSRGTGKTTCAKILAKVINCESPVNGNPCGKCAACLAIDEGSATDVIEMDAASNNGVDDIRILRDAVVYTPAMLKKRVYIIDEVHMLSSSAFNALLKTLEEPPAHVVFILATTELNKLPSTIISRCQRFDFRRIAVPVLMQRLLQIAQAEKIDLEEEAAQTIARQAQGGMRDAISLLELCAGNRSTVTAQVVNDAVGSGGWALVVKTVRAVLAEDYDTLFSVVAEIVRSSKNLSVFWQELLGFYRNLLVSRTVRTPAEYLDLTAAESAEVGEIGKSFTKEKLLAHIKLLEGALSTVTGSGTAAARVGAELTLVRLCDPSLDASNESLLARVATLEGKMATGVYSSAAPTPVPATAAATAHAQQAQPDPGVSLPKSPPKQSPEPMPPPATATAIPTTAPEKNKGVSNRRVLRALREWMEIVEKIRTTDSMLGSFVENAKGYECDDGKVIVRFKNELMLTLFDNGNGKDMLRGLISASLRRDISDRMLTLETESKKIGGHDSVDEIIEALDAPADS